MFSAQKSLQELDLAENLLSDLEDGAFFGMDSLAVLNLTSNQVPRVQGSMYQGDSDQPSAGECLAPAASLSSGPLRQPSCGARHGLL